MRKLIILGLATALLVGGCDTVAPPQSSVEETPAPETAPETALVAAEGVLEPARWSELRFEVAGTVAEVAVEAGETVEVGAAVARLDDTEAQLAVREAEFALAAAEANLALLQAGPPAEEIAAGKANLDDAGAALERALAQRDEVTGGATTADIAAAQAELTAAEGEWLRARDDRDALFRNTDEGDEDDMEERDQANYRFAAVVEALEAARVTVAARQSTAGERIREAEASVASAEARRDIAAAELALVEAGSEAWEIASAEADVAEATAALNVAAAALVKMVLRSPFRGTVTKVDVEVGGLVEPGQVVAVVATVNQLEVHTLDLTELDVARVAAGQPAAVSADALPGTKFRGHVTRVGLRAEDYRGDVTYPVTVALDETASELRWGMTALVEIQLD